MSQRNSGYNRKPGDWYATPDWVTQTLLPHIPDDVTQVWEPATGDGAMARALADGGFSVLPTDIDVSRCFFAAEMDFLKAERCDVDAIITNPPYTLATEFIEQALRLSESNAGMVAMLLRVDFDSAKTRTHLFADNPAWAKKLILTKRIRWFPGKSGPSENHAWYLWDWQHEGPPVLSYGPRREREVAA